MRAIQRQSANDKKAASSSFNDLLSSDVVVTRTSSTGRGVIVFKNYIVAAVIAHIHSTTLENLISLDGLARITRSALEQFHKIYIKNKGAIGNNLREEYQKNAEASYELLTRAKSRPAILEVVAGERQLSGYFVAERRPI